MILALDLATIRCGYCGGDGLSTPEASAWVFPHVGDDLGALAVAYEDCLTGAIERFRPEMVLYEAPILTGRDRLVIIRKLYGLGWETERVCKRLGIPCYEAGLKRIKKELAGHAWAEKNEMVAAALKCGVVLPPTLAAGKEDAADAFGAWLLGLRHHNPKASATWDSKLYAARGALL